MTQTEHPQDGDGRPPGMTLRARVTMLTAICVAGAVALVSLGAYLTVRMNLYNQVEQDLLTRATVTAGEQAQSAPASPNNPLTIRSGTYQISDIAIDVIDPTGASFIVDEPSSLRVPRDAISGAEKAVADGASASSARVVGGYEVVAVPYPCVGGSNCAALVIAEPLTAQRDTLANLSLVLIVISGIGIVVAAAAGAFVARGGLRPVQRLTEATEWVARTGDLRSIPVSGDDELARLTQSFNAMLGALAESREQQRRLVADAGHELRTPLTSLRTNLELLIASRRPGAPSLSEQDTAELYADVRGQLDELTTLIGDLVELARQDAPQVVHEPVELVEVVERALDRARRRATTVRFDVSLTPWTLLGDSNALERAVLNLLDNAVKFSPADGVVRVVLRALGDGTAVIEVSDQGPGIEDADLPHVFERFYRSEEARTLPGSGLGLAIVMQAAQRHGGMAYASHAAEGGALLTVRLPGRPA
ncbi:MAG TPA: HAMP domain-containing sensor histidine kinase [Pseudonocardiaceae bacterium]|jgi:two-component system sensor histidine kinase MprB|nr:HAMP domain-containing sensor histidine kinase [Pseudonocardiaceae bacterium]